MITKNQVFTEIADNVTAYCTQVYEIVPESLPCVYFRWTSYANSNRVTLDNLDEQERVTVYIEIYAEDETDTLTAQVNSIMKRMGFIKETEQPLKNYDPRIKRMSLRYQRNICGGDIYESSQVS